MKKKLSLALIVFCAFSASVFSQNFTVLSSQTDNVQILHTLSPFQENKVVIQGNEYQNFSKTEKVVLDHLGEPAMPYYTATVLVPNNGKVSYQINYDDFYEIENIAVAPSKGNLKRNVNPDDIPYTFGEVYHQDAFYPGELAYMEEPFILRKTRGVTIALYPYQYNPVTNTLRVYTNIEVRVTSDLSKSGHNELQVRGVSAAEDALSSFYSSFYLNPPITPKNYTPVEETGDMLIITDEDYLDAILPLADWRVKKGTKTTVVTTATAGQTDTEIKSYIEDFYANNPELIFILLVGDSNVLPSHTYGFDWGEERWSDSYYGQLAGGANDFYPEAFVGRLSGNESQIEVMVERTLEYEQNPLAGDWMTKAIGLGSNEGAGYGDDGESDYQHLRNIRTQLLDDGYTEVYEFYQGSQGGNDAPGDPNAAMINQAINDGVGLFNYTGHGALHVMSTGNYTSSAVNQATNNGKYPFVVSVACNNGTFVGANCLAETMMRATHNDSPTGAIGVVASSILMAWAPPMQTQDEMTNIITKLYDDNQKETLGGLFYNSQMSVLAEYNNSATAKEVMQTWIFFGDPSVSYRYKPTQEIIATHPAMLNSNAGTFVVSCDIDGTLFSLSQNGVVLGKAYASGGEAHISFEEFYTDEPLTIVGSKQNYKPYMNEINAVLGLHDNALSRVVVYPNPTDALVHINWTAEQMLKNVTLRDLTGRTVLSQQLQGTQESLNVSDIQSGVYLLILSNETQTNTRKIIIK